MKLGRALVPQLVSCLALASTTSCEPLTVNPSFAIGDLEVSEFQPSDTYVLWWAELEECASRSGSLEDLRFLEVTAPLSQSGQQFPCFEPGRLCNGVWQAPFDIYVASGLLDSERTVKHEMLHALLQTTEHPSVFFACTG